MVILHLLKAALSSVSDLNKLIYRLDVHVCLLQNISSRSMAMEKRFRPNLALLITSTVSSDIYIYISGSIRYYTIYLPPLVSHYAEGTLMPVLFQRMVFEYVPKNSPFWIRPIIRPVFKQLEELLVKPEIKNNLAMVCISGYLFIDERKN